MAELNQVFEFISTLKNIPWRDVNSVDLQKWIDDPQCLSIELQRFLKNFPQINAEEKKSEPTKRWREVDGVIYLTVTLDKPTAGGGWISRTETKGNRVGDYAKSVLYSKNFKSSAAGTHEIVVLKSSLFEDNDRITQNIHAKAKEMNLQTPNADIACLIREQFTDKEIEAMGHWWIVAMHEPIEDFDGRPRLLAASRGGDGRWLYASDGYPDDGWVRGHGFAFLAPQVP